MKHFKIYSGYNDHEPISIDESELVKAIQCQVTGQVFIAKRGATISGSQISKILPDYEKLKSDEKGYDPNIGTFPLPQVKAAHQLEIENAGELVRAAMEHRPPVIKTLAPRAQIHTQGPTALKELLGKKQQ